MSGGQVIIPCGTGDPIPGTAGHSTVKALIPKKRSFWWVKDREEYQVTLKNNWWHDNGLADRCTEMLAHQPPTQGPWLSDKQRQRYDQGPKFTLACKASFYRPENPQKITISRDLLMSFSRLARDMVWNWEATANSGLYQNELPGDLEWFQLVSNYYDQPPPPFTVFDPENKFVNPVDDTSVIRHQPQAFWKAAMCFFKYIQNGPPLEIKLDGEITKEFLIRHARAVGSPMFWNEIHVQFPGIVNGYEGGKLVAPDQEEAILRTKKQTLRMEAGLPDWEAAGHYTSPAKTRSTRNRVDRKQYNTSYHPLDDEMSPVDEFESDYDKMSLGYQTPNDDEMSDGEHIPDDEVAGPGRSLPRGPQLLSSRAPSRSSLQIELQRLSSGGTYPPGSFLASAPPSLSGRPQRKRQRASTSAATPPKDDEMSDSEEISGDEAAGPARPLPSGPQLLSSRGTYPTGSFPASAPPSLSERPSRKRQRRSNSAATPVQASVQPSLAQQPAQTNLASDPMLARFLPASMSGRDNHVQRNAVYPRYPSIPGPMGDSLGASEQLSFAGYGSRQLGTVDNYVMPAVVPPPHRPSPQPSVSEALQQPRPLDHSLGKPSNSAVYAGPTSHPPNQLE